MFEPQKYRFFVKCTMVLDLQEKISTCIVHELRYKNECTTI